jgi:KaiC/GvpD/RAD55 family RecA-like ATPase
MYDLGPHLEHATVDPGSNILVSGPPLTGKVRLATETLAYGTREGHGVIIVTTRDSARRVLDDFEVLVDDPESVNVGIVDCVTKHQGRSAQDTEVVKYASSPEDMTGIGIKFSEFVEEFQTSRGVERIRVVFDSLTPLLMYSDLQTVFQFMHVFTSRIDNAGAVALYVIDSTAHEAETANTLKQLFDGVIETDEATTITATLPGVDLDRIEP